MRPLGLMKPKSWSQFWDYLWSAKKIEYSLEGNTISVPASEYNSLKFNMVQLVWTGWWNAGDDILMQDMVLVYHNV